VTKTNLFKWRHHESEIIHLCVRWYLRYALSYRDLEEMMRERGLSVDHTTIYRWVQAYAPELERRIRPHLRLINDSYRVDETYVKIKGKWYYLYRAVDSTGQTIDFMLSANIIEQGHRFTKRRVNPGLGFFSFNTARRTIGGYEAMNMIRKGQVEGIGKGDILGQVRFVADLFEVVA
jgi:transposase-like protein